MLKFTKYLYHNTWVGKKIIDFVLEIHQYYRTHYIKEELFLKQQFKKRFGRALDLDNPQTFNEKLQWLKLNDRTALHTICADKYKVRDYVKEKIGEEYLVPLVFETKNPKDIIPENLPDYPVIIKTNHASYGGVIVRDKSQHNWKTVQKTLAKSLRINYYYKSKEWQYKNIERRIVVEKLLTGDSGDIPFDYKMHYFNG